MLARTPSRRWSLSRRTLLFSAALASAAITGAACRPGRRTPGGTLGLPGAGPKAATSPLVKSITVIRTNSKSLDWARGPNKILFDALGDDGYFDVHMIDPDGSNDRCLTCGPQAPRKHNGNATWRAQGDFIVFTAEKPDAPRIVDLVGIPGAGVGADLWAMTSNGERFFQLTNLPSPISRDAKATIHPQFSPDGQKLAWAERQAGGGAFGVWAIKIADFVVGSQGPRLENVRTYQPGQQHQFYETHDWSPDGTRLLFCGNLEPEQPGFGLDIYELDVATGTHRRLTRTPTDWDEHAHYSPNGTKIAWMSSTGLSIQWGSSQGRDFHRLLKSELWLMNADGSEPQRLTFFNEPGSAEYTGRRTVVSDNAWSPDGTRIVATVAYEGQRGQIGGTQLVMIELR
jgi:Tol biopolymer transport system component